MLTLSGAGPSSDSYRPLSIEKLMDRIERAFDLGFEGIRAIEVVCATQHIKDKDFEAAIQEVIRMNGFL